MVSFNSLFIAISITLATTANGYIMWLYDGPNKQGKYYEYRSCDGDQGCFPINPPLTNRVWSYKFCAGGKSSLTLYPENSCKGQPIKSVDGGIEEFTFEKPVNAMSFRVSGSPNTCSC